VSSQCTGKTLWGRKPISYPIAVALRYTE
jgi:hypothetical protein